MNITKELIKIAKDFKANFLFDKQPSLYSSEYKIWEKKLEDLRNRNLTLSDSSLLSTEELKELGAARLISSEKGKMKWRIYVLDQNSKRLVKKALDEKRKELSVGFKPSDLKKPAMSNSKGEYKWM